MPQMQTSTLSAASIPVLANAVQDAEAHDIALGCECADPSLQIERWSQEMAAPARGSADTH